MRHLQTSAVLVLTLFAAQALGNPTLEIDRTTARPGQLVTVTMRNPTIGTAYWVGLYEKTAIEDPLAELIDHANLGGDVSARFLMPTAQGDYYFRLYANADNSKASTSAPITVECPPVTLTVDTILANAGQVITVHVVGGPNNPEDYIRMNLSNTPDTQSINHKFLNG